jgi:hypothetical protein
MAVLALGGLSVLAPLGDDPAPPKLVLDFGLLVMFWFAYVTFMLVLLVWVAASVLGGGNGQKPRQVGEME